MKTVEYYLCDGCRKTIIGELDGLVIHGSLYTTNPKNSGGLVGSSIEPDKNGLVEYNKILKTVLCRECFDAATWDYSKLG
jgi:hypothetical protein